jgi:hypothetical protein
MRLQIESPAPFPEAVVSAVSAAVDAYFDARHIGMLGPVASGGFAPVCELRQPTRIEVSLGAMSEGIATLPLLRGMLRRRLDDVELFDIGFWWDPGEVPGSRAAAPVHLPWPVSMIAMPVDSLRSREVAIYRPGDPVHLEVEFAAALDAERQSSVRHAFEVFDAVVDGGLPSRLNTACGSIVGAAARWFLSPQLFVVSWEGILAVEAWAVLVQNWLAANQARLMPTALRIW